MVETRPVLSGDSVRAERGKQIVWGVAGKGGTMIRYVCDLALLRTIDRTVRLSDKTAQISEMPIAPGLPLVAVHAVLHHGPSAVPPLARVALQSADDTGRD